MLQIKLSVYKDGLEVAWATFNKNSGVDDAWFDPSRIVDSHPWDKAQLQANTANFKQEIHGLRSLLWTMSEGSKLNAAEEDRLSAHARWVAMESKNSCGMIVGAIAGPAIMYSKHLDPAFLIHRGKYREDMSNGLLALGVGINNYFFHNVLKDLMFVQRWIHPWTFPLRFNTPSCLTYMKYLGFISRYWMGAQRRCTKIRYSRNRGYQCLPELLAHKHSDIG